MAEKNGQSYLEAVITIGDLATLTVLSERQIRRLTNQGIFKRARNKKGQFLQGRYVLGETIPHYIEHLRNSLLDEPDEKLYQAARARRMEAEAERSELELKLLKGEVHRGEDVDFILTNMITAAKQQILGTANRITRQLIGLTNYEQIYNILYNEHEAICNTIAGYSPKQFEKLNRAYMKKLSRVNGSAAQARTRTSRAA
jgi:hypothetical protein